jgi:LysM repeat protein
MPLTKREAVNTGAVTLPVHFGAVQTGETILGSPASETVATFYQRVQSQIKGTLADQVTPLRLAGHLSVLVVGAAILILSQIKLPDWNITLDALPNNALSGANSLNATEGVTPAQSDMAAGSESMSDALQRSAVPFTVIQEKKREGIELYTVQAGDTVLGIAAKYGIQPETVLWANAQIEQNPDRLAIGDRLNVLPLDGVLHVVKPGDTLSSLASKYKIGVDQIVGYADNELPDAMAALKIGSQLVIPGGTKPFITPQVPAGALVAEAPVGATKGSGSFSWPTSGNITQQFWGGHRAIDVGSWVGAPAKAADSGYVVLAGGGWNGGYGNHVIIDHGNGFTTLYAHLNSIFVRPGESVSRGQQIGTVGNTGNSTGPHLHFEIRYQGVPRNPFNWLP